MGLKCKYWKTYIYCFFLFKSTCEVPFCEQVIKEKFGLFQSSLFKEVVGEVGVKKKKTERMAQARYYYESESLLLTFHDTTVLQFSRETWAQWKSNQIWKYDQKTNLGVMLFFISRRWLLKREEI